MKPFLRTALVHAARHGFWAAVVMSLGLPLSSCGGPGAGGPEPFVAAVHRHASTRAALSLSRRPLARATELLSDAAARSPGEFVVFRFTGSFRRAPLLLTERVVAREGSLTVVDYTLVEQVGRDRARGVRRSSSKPSARADALRVRFDLQSGAQNEVSSVHRLVNGVEVPERRDAFEAMVASTVVATDENLETLARQEIERSAFGQALPCEQVTYRVRVASQSAKMTIVRSDQFVWGDLGAEIVLEDGTLFYRAELVDSGRHQGA